MERDEILAEIAGQTPVTLLRANAAAHGELPALSARDGEGWATLTWAQYREQVDAVAAALIASGVAAGDRVAIMAGNRPEHVVADLAVLSAGAVPVSVYPTLSPEQVAYVVNDAAAVTAILQDRDVMKGWEEIRHELATVRQFVLMEDAADWAADDAVIAFDEVIAAGRARLAAEPGIVDERVAAASTDDGATVIYTSGTTGKPKGVELTHENVMFLIASLARVTAFEDGYVNLSYLPLAHIAERLFSHYFGLRFHGHTWFCAEQTLLLPTMVTARPQAFLGVPRVWEKLKAGVSAALPEGDLPDEVTAAVRAKIGLDRCTFCVSGAAPMAVDVLEFWAGLGLPICEAYGMTETTGVSNINRPGEQRYGTVGPAIPGVEVRLLEDGEVVSRGPNIMAGYLNRPEDTAEARDADGWMHTGDLGEIGADGFLRIVGRKKELIITAGGKNIAPVAVEALIKQHPIVGQVCAVGDRRPYLTALIVLDPDVVPGWVAARGIEATDVASLAVHPEVVAEVQQAVDQANEHVSRVEQIKRFVVLPRDWTPDTGELTPTLKLKRSVIHGLYADEIDTLYA